MPGELTREVPQLAKGLGGHLVVEKLVKFVDLVVDAGGTQVHVHRGVFVDQERVVLGLLLHVAGDGPNCRRPAHHRHEFFGGSFIAENVQQLQALADFEVVAGGVGADEVGF